MFLIAAVLFTVFSIFYALFSAAVIYHLKQYILPQQPFVRLVIAVFLFVSGLFWFLSLYFLFKIPS